MKKFGFLITAYQQIDNVKKQIDVIRNQFKTEEIRNAPIIIVTTTESDSVFGQFEELSENDPNVFCIHFYDAPGSDTCKWFIRRPNREAAYWSWRHEFLPPRIMYSMQKGIRYADTIGIHTLLHLHSDTLWDPAKEANLVENISIIQDQGKYAIIDISLHEEDHARESKIVPGGLHWLPEGIMLNLPKCKEIGFGFDFYKIFGCDGRAGPIQDYGFYATNYGMIERLFGTFYHWCLTGINITKFDDKIDRRYADSLYFRKLRTYHGSFDYGLVNFPGVQPDNPHSYNEYKSNG